jgi:hypothetical protein
MATHSLPHSLKNCESYSRRGKSLPSAERMSALSRAQPFFRRSESLVLFQVEGISRGAPLSWKNRLLRQACSLTPMPRVEAGADNKRVSILLRVLTMRLCTTFRH